MILGAVIAVAAQIAWRLAHPVVPLLATMRWAALLNLAANAGCLYLLCHSATATSMRPPHGNVPATMDGRVSPRRSALGVGLFGARWPDRIVAATLLVVFLRSSLRVLGSPAVICMRRPRDWPANDAGQDSRPVQPLRTLRQ